MTDKKIAILCAGADHPALHLLGDILRDVNSVIFVGIDRGAYRLIQAGYPLDYALGDFDSVSDKELDLIYSQSKKVYRVQAEKDDTDTELAFEWVKANHPDVEIFLFGAMGASMVRLDHKIANLYLVYQPRFQELMMRTHLIEDDLYIRWYGPGKHAIHSGANMPDYLSIISMTPVQGLEIRGAKYELPATDIGFPRAYVSNEFISTEDTVYVSLKTGLLMIQWVNERSQS